MKKINRSVHREQTMNDIDNKSENNREQPGYQDAYYGILRKRSNWFAIRLKLTACLTDLKITSVANFHSFASYLKT